MFNKETVRDIDLEGKTVLLRADYNVPLQDGRIADDYRIQQSLPTVQYILERASKLIICSHLGRPTGPGDSSSSLFPVAKRLTHLLDQPVEFATDCVGTVASKAVDGLPKGGVLLLENLRFHPEEKANDDEFAKQLASLADVFVQDGFGVVHRADASTDAITKYIPSVAGLLLEKEDETITKVMENPERPLMAIVGGAKIADKLDILNKLIVIADVVAIGGAMANTFLAAKGYNVGDSLYDKDQINVAKHVLKTAEMESAKRRFVFSLPHDVVVAQKIDKAAPTRIVELNTHTMADIQHYPKRVPAESSQIHAHEKILDLGPFSASFIAGAVQLSNTVLWNGTLGVTETESLQGPIGPTAHATQTLTEALLGELGHKPYTVVGGGDTVGYLETRKLLHSFDFVSTGGGASLELMSGHSLPGVDALRDKK